ncbi:NUT family member 2 isoform X2 [Cricetulus griseus]|uniref:NUT family member 2 isoform X2 n=1 Tax=Cricetulus griseus TaxID=10029 RepID=A0A9J7JTG5_CRIGR|nr:NUT family member 2 isoform X2 [Cricetulus griseus]
MDPSKQAWLLSKPVGITSEASSLGQNMTVNLDAAMSTFATLPVLPPAPQPTLQLFWEPQEPLLTGGISPWNPLVLSALPGMSLVAEDGSTTLGTAVPLNIVQIGTTGRPVQPMPNANLFLTQVSLNCNVPVTQGGVIGCPASDFMTTHEANTFINAQIASAFQNQEVLWVLGSHPPTTQPVVQLVPVQSPVNSAPPPKGAVVESGPANVQTNSTENCLSKPDSVYGNIRRWQHIKTLVQRHLSQTPDVSAFSCFLIPVLRSLAQRKPTMNVEEGLWRGLQEWQCTSNYDRMIFFEMAEKFKEFENAEEKENSRLEFENSRLEMTRSIKCQVLTTTRQDPPRFPAPEVFEEPVCNSMKIGSITDPACLPVFRHRQLQKTEATMEIPPEAMQEYMDITDWLERPPQSNTGNPTEKEQEENSEPEQEEDDFYSDAGVLSYIDELCSQKHFVDQVEDIIHPQFVAEILSSKPEIDILSLMKDLEYEEEFSVEQLVEENCMALKKKGCKRATLKPGAPQILSNASFPTVCQDAKREGHGPQRGTSAQKRSSLVPSLDHQFPGATNAEIWGPSPTVFQSSQCLPSLGDLSSTVITYGRGAHPQSPGSRCAMSLRGVSAMEEFQEALGRTIEDKEEIPSLSFLLCSHYSLVPWKLSGYLCPYTGLSDSASIPKPLSPRMRDLSPDPSSNDKSNKPALIGGLTPMAKRSNSGLGHGIFEGPLSALGLTHSLQAQKFDSLSTRKRKRKKWHCVTCGMSRQSRQSFTLPPPCTPIPKMKKKTH